MSCYPILYLEKPMFALILCGGKSTRMGTDKGLMKLNQNQNWVQSMYQKCRSVGLDTLLSINLSQVDTYAQYFNIEDYVIDNFQDIGPFNALLSFYEKYPLADVLVVSCDMIDLSVEFLKNLVAEYQQTSMYDVIIPERQEGFYQPFPGIYTSEFLQKLYALHLTQQISKYSFQSILQLFSTYEFKIETSQVSQLKSYNSKDDL